MVFARLRFSLRMHLNLHKAVTKIREPFILICRVFSNNVYYSAFLMCQLKDAPVGLYLVPYYRSQTWQYVNYTK